MERRSEGELLAVVLVKVGVGAVNLLEICASAFYGIHSFFEGSRVLVRLLYHVHDLFGLRLDILLGLALDLYGWLGRRVVSLGFLS